MFQIEFIVIEANINVESIFISVTGDDAVVVISASDLTNFITQLNIYTSTSATAKIWGLGYIYKFIIMSRYMFTYLSKTFYYDGNNIVGKR